MESGVQNASGRDVGQEGDVGDGECRYFIPSCYVFRSLVLLFEISFAFYGGRYLTFHVSPSVAKFGFLLVSCPNLAMPVFIYFGPYPNYAVYEIKAVLV